MFSGQITSMICLTVFERFDFLSVVTIRRLRRIPFIEVRITDEAGEPIAVMTSSGYRKDVELSLPDEEYVDNYQSVN